MDGGLVYLIRNVIFTREATLFSRVCAVIQRKSGAACAATGRYVDVAVIHNDFR